MTSYPQNRATFATTQWTRVAAAGGDSPEARAALGELCSIYYEPVVTFLQIRFRSEDRGRELAHDFFQHLLKRNFMAGANPERGRFRSYLLGAVKHFVADQLDRERAAKRGGDATHVPIEAGTDTSPGVDPPDGTRNPELAFDRRWALTVLDRAITRLEREHASPERRARFEALKPWLTGTGESLANRAASPDLNEGALKVAVHRLRKRFRELVRAEIAATVTDASDVRAEMRHLVDVLSA